MVHGTHLEVVKAKAIIDGTQPVSVTLHSAGVAATAVK
jgi:hypothetical protein